jgi:hypothetical protein
LKHDDRVAEAADELMEAEDVFYDCEDTLNQNEAMESTSTMTSDDSTEGADLSASQPTLAMLASLAKDLSVSPLQEEMSVSLAKSLSTSRSVEEVLTLSDEDPLASPSTSVSSANRLTKEESTPSTVSLSVEDLSAEAQSIGLSDTSANTQLVEIKSIEELSLGKILAPDVSIEESCGTL